MIKYLQIINKRKVLIFRIKYGTLRLYYNKNMYFPTEQMNEFENIQMILIPRWVNSKSIRISSVIRSNKLWQTYSCVSSTCTSSWMLFYISTTNIFFLHIFIHVSFHTYTHTYKHTQWNTYVSWKRKNIILSHIRCISRHTTTLCVCRFFFLAFLYIFFLCVCVYSCVYIRKLSLSLLFHYLFSCLFEIFYSSIDDRTYVCVCMCIRKMIEDTTK